MNPMHLLDYGALGAAVLIILVAVGVLYRVLAFVREILSMVLERIQDNTRALAILTSRLGDSTSPDEMVSGFLAGRFPPTDGPATRGDL